MQLPIPLTDEEKRSQYFSRKESGITPTQIMFLRYYLGDDEQDYSQNGRIVVYAVESPTEQIIQRYNHKPILGYEVVHSAPLHQQKVHDQRDTYEVDTFAQAMALLSLLTSDATIYATR